MVFCHSRTCFHQCSKHISNIHYFNPELSLDFEAKSFYSPRSFLPLSQDRIYLSQNGHSLSHGNVCAHPRRAAHRQDVSIRCRAVLSYQHIFLSHLPRGGFLFTFSRYCEGFPRTFGVSLIRDLKLQRFFLSWADPPHNIFYCSLPLTFQSRAKPHNKAPAIVPNKNLALLFLHYIFSIHLPTDLLSIFNFWRISRRLPRVVYFMAASNCFSWNWDSGRLFNFSNNWLYLYHLNNPDGLKGWWIKKGHVFCSNDYNFIAENSN